MFPERYPEAKIVPTDEAEDVVAEAYRPAGRDDHLQCASPGAAGRHTWPIRCY